MAHPTLVIGQIYFVENPQGKSFVGRLTHILDPFTVALEEASWVANSGRYHQFCRTGNGGPNMEIEPCGRVPAARYQSIVDWPHKLFTEAI